MTNQETQGLLSPLIRDLRLRRAAARIEPGAVVLDLACGAGQLADHLDPSCTYVGVDRIPSPERAVTRGSRARSFVCLDLLDGDAVDRLRDALPEPPTALTLIAFLEHVADPADVLRRFASLLAPGGRIVGTTPHPAGRRLHDSLARLYLCSRDGADEHETFLGRQDLAHAAEAAGRRLTEYRRFLFGLNQLFVIEER